jgi:hypothetical protein
VTCNHLEIRLALRTRCGMLPWVSQAATRTRQCTTAFSLACTTTVSSSTYLRLLNTTWAHGMSQSSHTRLRLTVSVLPWDLSRAPPSTCALRPRLDHKSMRAYHVPHAECARYTLLCTCHVSNTCTHDMPDASTTHPAAPATLRPQNEHL